MDAVCSCGSKWIHNKTYGLCYRCNYKRLHKKTPEEARIEKMMERKREVAERMLYEGTVKRSFLSDRSRKCSVKYCIKDASSAEGRYGRKPLCEHHLREWYADEKRRRRKKKQLKQMTSKERVIKSELSVLKKKAKEEKRMSGNSCEGCFKTYNYDLEYSHILSVGQRKDLENDPDNKNMLCRDCHNKWESNNAQKMTSLACFMSNMKYIRKKDVSRFWSIYFILNDAMMIKECNELEQIDNNNK